MKVKWSPNKRAAPGGSLMNRSENAADTQYSDYKINTYSWRLTFLAAHHHCQTLVHPYDSPAAGSLHQLPLAVQKKHNISQLTATNASHKTYWVCNISTLYPSTDYKPEYLCHFTWLLGALRTHKSIMFIGVTIIQVSRSSSKEAIFMKMTADKRLLLTAQLASRISITCRLCYHDLMQHH